MAARSGKELERRRHFSMLSLVSDIPLSSRCETLLRIPNCFRNHFFVSGLMVRDGLLLLLSLSILDFRLLSFGWLKDVSISIFLLSICKTSRCAGSISFPVIVVLRRKKRKITRLRKLNWNTVSNFLSRSTNFWYLGVMTHDKSTYFKLFSPTCG